MIEKQSTALDHMSVELQDLKEKNQILQSRTFDKDYKADKFDQVQQLNVKLKNEIVQLRKNQEYQQVSQHIKYGNYLKEKKSISPKSNSVENAGTQTKIEETAEKAPQIQHYSQKTVSKIDVSKLQKLLNLNNFLNENPIEDYKPQNKKYEKQDFFPETRNTNFDKPSFNPQIGNNF